MDIPNEFPHGTTLDEIKVAIRKSQQNPNIGRTFHTELKRGPRTYKIATMFEIMNTHTGDLHHHSLRLDSFTRLKTGWLYVPERSIHIDGQDGEIEALIRFVVGTTYHEGPDSDGVYRLVDEQSYLTVENIAKLVQRADTSARSQIMRAVIEEISDAGEIPFDLEDAFSSGSVKVLNSIATSARIVQYRRALQELKSVVESESPDEADLQRLLEANPWLFGSEYSELLDRRSWTRDDRLDFMLRRTVDDYLEVVEIKKPVQEPLFLYDRSHDSHYPSSILSKVIGQVMRYIEELERDRDSIIAKDGYDPLKVRARIIVGRDGNSEQQRALHNLNAHLTQIEVITFDQLVRIGERVLGVFQDTLSRNEMHEEADYDNAYPFDTSDADGSLPDDDSPF